MAGPEPNLQEKDARSKSRAECKPLVEAATKNLYRKNAFRVLGLATDATAREVSKHGAKVKQMEELGMANTVHAPAFPLNPPPSRDELRDMLQRLQDPEKRLVDEFFWFWPEQFGKSSQDPAIQALQAGDTETACKIWSLKESDPANGLVAIHNAAVVWHMTALEYENNALQLRPSGNWRAKVDGFWADALKRWERLLIDEKFWEKFQERVRQIDDPRLTSGFIHRLRTWLPEAIGKINGELALQYAEAGDLESAKKHALLMRDTNPGLLEKDRVVQLVLTPESNRLREEISRAQHVSVTNPRDGARLARELARRSSQLVVWFDLIGGSNSRFRNDLFDEAADVCNKILMAYQRATMDGRSCVEILETVLPFTTFATLKERIDKNIAILSNRSVPNRPAVKAEQAKPAHPPPLPPVTGTAKDQVAKVLLRNFGEKSPELIIGKLQEMQNGKDLPSQKLAWFYTAWFTKLERAVSELPTETDAYWNLCLAAGNLLRAISLQAADQQKDMPTAMRANELASRFAKTPELWVALKKDLARFQLKKHILADRKLIQKLVGVAVSCFILLLIGAHFHRPDPYAEGAVPPAQTSPMVVGSSPAISSPSPTVDANAPAFPLMSSGAERADSGVASNEDAVILSGTNTYSIPGSRTNELAQDLQTIRKQSARVRKLGLERQKLQVQMFSIGQAMDRERAQLGAVMRLKQLALEEETRKLNDMISSYNAKLKTYAQ